MFMHRDGIMFIIFALMPFHEQSTHAPFVILTRVVTWAVLVAFHPRFWPNHWITFDPRADIFEVKHDAHSRSSPPALAALGPSPSASTMYRITPSLNPSICVHRSP